MLRTSVGQNLWSKQDVNFKNSGLSDIKNQNSLNTAVRAGATLKFGEFSVDGLISTNASGDGTSGAGGTDVAASTNGGNGNLRTDNLMTRVAATYRF